MANLLEAFDPAHMRKTRRNSMMMLRAASQLNLAADEEDGEKSDALIPTGEKKAHHHEHTSETTEGEAMTMCVSALYGKLLVVIGMGFPIAQTLSRDLPRIYYNSFYLYLYFGSILFVIFAYVSLLSSFTMQMNNVVLYFREIQVYIKPFTASWTKYFKNVKAKICFGKKKKKKDFIDELDSSTKSDYVSSVSLSDAETAESADEMSQAPSRKSKFVYTENAGHGSMYLKMGTIIFGIGSMIYSGLEFGQYFELSNEAICSDILMAITPAARMVFTFLQMYFIFLNSRVSISRHTFLARFGIMHMVGTNLCIWLNVLVEETKHTIHHVLHTSHGKHSNNTHGTHGTHDTHDSHNTHDTHESYGHHELNGHADHNSHELDSSSEFLPTPRAIISTFAPPKVVEGLFNNSMHFHHNNFHHNLVKRAASEVDPCRVVNLMGDMVESSAPLLYPCTIEYSLLCASVLYVMWKNIQKKSQINSGTNENDISQMIARKVRHLYSVDCGRASRGLFSGIFALVMTLISLIIFYVLVSSKTFKYYGLLSANLSEILIYSVGIITTVIGMKQLRSLSFIEDEELELDSILLVIAQGGVYMFNIFTLIGGYFGGEVMSTWTLITALLTLIQATLQTLYILDGSRRCCRTTEQLERKCGREMVTFQLVLNLSYWLLATFQTSRSHLHNAQQQFYGVWAWTIISHVSMPLGIFYRFHATVCLGEIWKRAYKMRSE